MANIPTRARSEMFRAAQKKAVGCEEKLIWEQHGNVYGID
jgi:hypothetical protein